MPILTEKMKPGIGGVPLPYTKPKKFPFLIVRRKTTELPTWIAYDKQVCVHSIYDLIVK